MGLYALSQRAGETYDAAGKAMQDVFAVLATKGSKTIWSMPKSCNKYMKILDLPYLACFLLFRAGKKDFLFYSIPENHVKIKLLKAMQKLKKYQIICFINDLNAFRYGNLDSEKVREKMQREPNAIGMADHVLIPNKNTAELLRKHGVKSHLVPVGVWDYLMIPEQIARLKSSREECQSVIRIAFAGNLNKSDFMFQMQLPKDAGVELEMWGKLDEEKKEKLPAFFHYHGVLPADEVPKAVAFMDYGLVWDGTGSDEIEGGLGDYLRYNNSHKCGLYLASGIPAIVWKEAGMADFVEEHHCGICVERLSELAEKIQNADYEELKQNAGKVAEELRRGDYLSRALDIILGDCES